MKSPMTDHAVQLMLKRLRGLSPNKKEQVEILEQSILNGWKGIFPLKVGDSQGEKWRQLE